MKQNFAAALEHVLAHEGGYVNHPADPGGPTKYGITLAVYRAGVKPDATAADVRAMPLAHARTIYRARYWDALACDALPAGLDYALFDYGVSSGVGRAGKVLRRLLGLADETHAVTGAVLAAVRRHDAAELIGRLCDERLAFLRRLKTWPVFGAGWRRRVAAVRETALRMARGAPAGKGASPAPGRGVVPLDKAAQRGTAGGLAAGGAAAAQQAAQAGASLTIVIVVLLAGAALALAAWLFWHRRQKRLQEA